MSVCGVVMEKKPTSSLFGRFGNRQSMIQPMFYLQPVVNVSEQQLKFLMQSSARGTGVRSTWQIA
jgi:hypothetical protein